MKLNTTLLWFCWYDFALELYLVVVPIGMTMLPEYVHLVLQALYLLAQASLNTNTKDELWEAIPDALL
jgi:hypothetical protein